MRLRIVANFGWVGYEVEISKLLVMFLSCAGGLLINFIKIQQAILRFVYFLHVYYILLKSL